MYKVLALLALVPLAIAAPGHLYAHGAAAIRAPGYGGYGAAPIAKAPACRTEYETVLTKQCSTSFSQACRTESRTKYKTEYEQQCQTITRQNCYQVAKPVADKVCATRYEQVCTQETQKTYDIGVEANCQDIVSKVCAPAIAAPAYGGYRGKREADPSGYGAPACQEVTKRVCSKTPVKTPRYVNVPNCQRVPRTDCKDVTRNTVETKCEPVEEQKCASVPKQASFEVPLEICESVPQENCVDVPKKVPKKICKEYKH